MFHSVKLIIYTSSHLNNKTNEIHRYSKSEIIILIGYYIVFSGSLVRGGSNLFVQTKREYPSSIRLFFTMAENSYNINICEMIHDLTKADVCTNECSICILFNNVSPISFIDINHIINIKEYIMGELVHGALDLCGWCVMKYQNRNNNKAIHRCLYDLQKSQRKMY